MADSQHDSLPSWWFEVDEVDDIDTNTSLLQELDIDLPQIYRSTIWMLLGPCGCLCRRNAGKHPLSGMLPPATVKVSTPNMTPHSNANMRSPAAMTTAVITPGGPSSGSFAPTAQIDFWGPCSIVSLYAALLWLDRVRNVGWLFVIWTLAAVFNHFVCRVFFKQSRLMIHFSLLGYSVTPLIPIAAVIIFLHPPIWLCTILEIVAVMWSSQAAFLSYLMVFNSAPDLKKRLLLILPSIILMEWYLLSLISVRPPR